jgi:hypothetical protein
MFSRTCIFCLPMSSMLCSSITSAEDGYRVKNFPSDNSKLAEMEFYLVSDLECNLAVFHPYRTLLTLCGRGQRTRSLPKQAKSGSESTTDRDTGARAREDWSWKTDHCRSPGSYNPSSPLRFQKNPETERKTGSSSTTGTSPSSVSSTRLT